MQFARHECIKALTFKGDIVPPASSLLRVWRRKLEALEYLEGKILCKIAGEPQAMQLLFEGRKGQDFLWELDQLWRERGSNPTDPLVEKIRATLEFLLAKTGCEANDFGKLRSLQAVPTPT